MTGSQDFDLDLLRAERVGLDEALFCAGKTVDQISRIVETMAAAGRSMLLTRLSEDRHLALEASLRALLSYDPLSRTAFLGALRPRGETARVAVVCAGTSDLSVSREAARTLEYYGEGVSEFNDVGVAGIHRLLSRIADIRAHEIVIAVPTSVGYGAARQGETALAAALASCAAGVSVVNIDNGFGAACAALRILNRRA